LEPGISTLGTFRSSSQIGIIKTSQIRGQQDPKGKKPGDLPLMSSESWNF